MKITIENCFDILFRFVKTQLENVEQKANKHNVTFNDEGKNVI